VWNVRANVKGAGEGHGLFSSNISVLKEPDIKAQSGWVTSGPRIEHSPALIRKSGNKSSVNSMTCCNFQRKPYTRSMYPVVSESVQNCLHNFYTWKWMGTATAARDLDGFRAVNVHWTLLDTAISRQVLDNACVLELSESFTTESGCKCLRNVDMARNPFNYAMNNYHASNPSMKLCMYIFSLTSCL
jgi:hypothetical protein